MARTNPLMNKFSKDLSEYNRNIGSILDRVASKQYKSTVIVIIVNVIAAIALQLIPEFTIGQVNSSIISVLFSLFLLLISVPIASEWGKKHLEKEALNLTNNDPSIDYSGEWKYNTTFFLKSPDDGSDEYKLVEKNMNPLIETGKTTWIFNYFDLHIDFAATDEIKEDTKKKTRVEWTSGPIEYTSDKVSWTFEGRIKWKGGEDIVNVFKGMESYRVVARDENRKPTLLKGNLTGIIQVNNKYYVVTAEESEYVRLVDSNK